MEIVPVDVLDGVVTEDTAAAVVVGAVASAITVSGGSEGPISSIWTSGMVEGVVRDDVDARAERVRPRDSSGALTRAGSLDCQKDGIVPGAGDLDEDDETVHWDLELP